MANRCAVLLPIWKNTRRKLDNESRITKQDNKVDKIDKFFIVYTTVDKSHGPCLVYS